MMNDVIDKLVEIEEEATKIVDNMGAEKIELARLSEQKKADFDVEFQKSLDEEILKMREASMEDAQKVLQTMREENKQAMEQLEKVYAKKHRSMAKEIVNRVIGV